MTAAPTAIPNGWRVVRLGDVCDTPRYGANAPARPFDPALPRYVRITDITDEGRLRTDDVRSAEPEKVRGHELRQGDLLFARSGSVGRTYLYRPEDGPCVYAGYLIRFRPDPTSALPRFVDLYTHSPSYYRWVDSVLHVGAQPNINAVEYSSLPLLLPPLREQRAIAAVLDSIDETIELADEVIAATERLRDALLHELLTRGLPGWHTDWRDIPGLGTIPSDWEVVRLGDVGRWLSGGTPSKARADYWQGKIPWVSPKDMKAREIRDAQDHISDEGARAGSRVVPAGAVLVVVRGMILAHSFPLAVSGVVAAFNQDIRALVCGDNFVPEFVLAALEHQKPRLLHLPTPSTHGTMRVVSEELFAVPVPRAPLPEQRAIAVTLDSIDAAIEGARAERDTLQSMKLSAADALLSGRVRISNAAEPDAPKATNVLESHMNRSEVLQTLRAHTEALAEQFGVTSLALFGSFARNQATDASDIDILAEFASPPGWREYFGAQAYLEAVLGRPVDLMTAGEVRPEIRPYVERDAINV